MGFFKMHVPASHWLAGTLTPGSSEQRRTAASQARGGRIGDISRSREANRWSRTDHLMYQEPHQTRIFGGITTFSHFLHRPQTQQHQRFRLIGTFELGFSPLARNDATFQKNTGQCP